MTAEATDWIACGVLRAELEALVARDEIHGRLHFLNSMLHMEPCVLEDRLVELILQTGGRRVLVFGYCCRGMDTLDSRPGVARVDAQDCGQLLLGHARYREWSRRQAFFLLPEWAGRWREVFEVGLGLSSALLSEFMQEHHRCLVYLDTGLSSIPHETLAACALATGLPLHVEPVSLDGLLAELGLAEERAATSLREGGKP